MARTSLSSLPPEIRYRILGNLLCSESGRPFENGGSDELDHPNIYTPVLQVDRRTYLEGIDLLYGENAFRFSSGDALDSFVGQINTHHPVTDLIPVVELQICLMECKQWIEYLQTGSFQKHFSKLLRLDLCFEAAEYDDDFPALVDALKANVKAEKICATGLNGEKAYEVCDGMEFAMTIARPVVPETEYQRAMKEYSERVHPSGTDEYGFLIPEKKDEDDDKEQGYW